MIKKGIEDYYDLVFQRTKVDQKPYNYICVWKGVVEFLCCEINRGQEDFWYRKNIGKGQSNPWQRTSNLPAPLGFTVKRNVLRLLPILKLLPKS